MAGAIAQDLHLHVAGALHVALEKNRIVAEGRGRLAPRFRQQFAEFRGAPHDPHAAPAAAEGCFDDQRKADAARHTLRVARVADGLFGARYRGDAGALRQLAGRAFVAQQFQQFGAGSDEGDTGPLASPRQSRILREEAVPRMDGVHAFFFRQGHDAVHIEVGFHRPLSLADQVRFVGLETVQGEAVLLGIDRHRAQSQFIGGAQDADGDLSAVQC